MVRIVIVLLSAIITFTPAQINFTDVTEASGLGGAALRKLAVADYNKDGYLDILVGGTRLFKNSGPPDYKFSEVTSDAGIGGQTNTIDSIEVEWLCGKKDKFADVHSNRIIKIVEGQGLGYSERVSPPPQSSPFFVIRPNLAINSVVIQYGLNRPTAD